MIVSLILLLLLSFNCYYCNVNLIEKELNSVWNFENHAACSTVFGILLFFTKVAFKYAALNIDDSLEEAEKMLVATVNVVYDESTGVMSEKFYGIGDWICNKISGKNHFVKSVLLEVTATMDSDPLVCTDNDLTSCIYGLVRKTTRRIARISTSGEGNTYFVNYKGKKNYEQFKVSVLGRAKQILGKKGEWSITTFIKSKFTDNSGLNIKNTIIDQIDFEFILKSMYKINQKVNERITLVKNDVQKSLKSYINKKIGSLYKQDGDISILHEEIQKISQYISYNKKEFAKSSMGSKNAFSLMEKIRSIIQLPWYHEAEGITFLSMSQSQTGNFDVATTDF